MISYNPTTIMLLDEDIRMKQDNARRLMIEDITNAVLHHCGKIWLPQRHHIPYAITDYSFDEIFANECGIHVATRMGNVSITQMDYEEIRSVYETLISEGYFQNE